MAADSDNHTTTSAATTDVDEKVRQSLKGTNFEAVSLEKLAGGSVNWSYRAKLLKPLRDGTTDVVVKHGELYMASKPDFPLPPLRCIIEVDILRALSDKSRFATDQSTGAYIFDVRTPKLLDWNEANMNQTYECLPDSIDLKRYILKYYTPSTPTSLEPQCRQLGAAVGSWLRGFAEWSKKQVELRPVLAQNSFAQDIKHMVNFLWLSERVDNFPGILGDVKDLLAEVEKMSLAERESATGYEIIHGDFWTGNIILPDRPITEGSETPLFVIDWECAQLALPATDFGQIVVELYVPWVKLSITAGLWAMEELVHAYGPFSEEFAFRTAIQIGTHLICITPTATMMGPFEEMGDVVRIGRDIVVHAWNKDRAWFEKGDLACLFESVI